jgi:Fe2+ or Zn2+ uptake regulation protein
VDPTDPITQLIDIEQQRIKLRDALHNELREVEGKKALAEIQIAGYSQRISALRQALGLPIDEPPIEGVQQFIRDHREHLSHAAILLGMLNAAGESGDTATNLLQVLRQFEPNAKAATVHTTLYRLSKTGHIEQTSARKGAPYRLTASTRAGINTLTERASAILEAETRSMVEHQAIQPMPEPPITAVAAGVTPRKERAAR